jgi:hypothetical protein
VTCDELDIEDVMGQEEQLRMFDLFASGLGDYICQSISFGPWSTFIDTCIVFCDRT